MKFREFIASQDDDDRRLDRIIRKFISEDSLSAVYKSIRKGLIKINDKKAEASQHVFCGDKIKIADFLLISNNKKSLDEDKIDFNLEIVFKTDDLIFINKPYDIAVQGNSEALNRQFELFYKKNYENTSLSFNPGPLHRLDRKTTGLIAFSLSLKGAKWFSKNIADHTIQKKYIGVIEFLMKNLDTKMFTLEFNALKKEKNCYGLFLKHNIDFDKVYSEDAINDTYSNGIIAEDKMIVLINLLLIQLIKDMILGKFDNKYILNLPGSIYSKKNKFDNVLKMLSDKYAMNNVIFLIDYDDLLKNKEIIKECRKNGYKFALIFNKDLSDTKGFKTNISLVDKIYIDKDNIKETKFNELIPKDFDVIYEDMTNKVGDLDEEVSS